MYNIFKEIFMYLNFYWTICQQWKKSEIFLSVRINCRWPEHCLVFSLFILNKVCIIIIIIVNNESSTYMYSRKKVCFYLRVTVKIYTRLASLPLAPVRVAAETKCVGGGGATAGVETIGDLFIHSELRNFRNRKMDKKTKLGTNIM